MNREAIYYLPEESSESTFCYDEDRPKLPLPALDHTLKRYLESLKPFGTAEELENSKRIIETFRKGVGAKLQAILEQRATKEKNWVEKWWEDYAYCTLRMPLIPYCVMVQPLLLSTVGLEAIPDNFLKGPATCLHHNMVFWKLLRTEKLRPIASVDKKVIFSADLYRRLYNTVRLPGLEMDKVQSYFKTEREGSCPSHIIVLYGGRIFRVPGLDAQGEPLAPQEFLFTLQQIQHKVESDVGAPHTGVPVLTNDDRTTWARNRDRLMELSQHNRDMLQEVESAVALMILDTHQPTGYSDLSQLALTGDVHSKWTDKSCGTIAFKNGQMGCYGEHCCYDGSISMAISLYVMMSIMEEGMPDWTVPPKELILPTEVVFDLDDTLRSEIVRMEQVANEMKTSVIVSMDQFQSYGKAFMKKHKIHPDAYVQTALLLTYYRLHGSFAPTYETAMMRQYYKGRTETCRSCSIEAVRFIEEMESGTAGTTSTKRAKMFRVAANRQMELMNEARQGNGIDRHLFGLWCAAYENDIPIPELYDDPLYSKSGGGGNFMLSTSTLGYTINCGYVAPMCTDGYGCFYSMLEDSIWAIFSAYRDSTISSAHKFQQTFRQVMEDLHTLLENGTEVENKL
ncbi:peroxisomal carnitine O-octanoyltransferase [Anopheles cruzii]|uniref:peroxisomal carnitine O-octanoyltransferase n=1 Tax=Anopheles cruzii TaxID=68878 RepID=UPI0022EC2A2C|nr:peroxisomal carnitine O-octanoyltransferase [Anopheles cruzii]